MAKVTDIIKTATTRLRNMLSKIEVVFKGDSQIPCRGCWCDILTQATCREKNTKFATLLWNLRNSVLSAFNFNLLSVIKWKISLRKSLSWFRERFVSGVAKTCRSVCHLRKRGDPSYHFG